MTTRASLLLLSALTFLWACGGTQAYVPPGPRVPIRIESAVPLADKTSSVTLRNEEEAQSCDVPCSLNAASGTTDISVRGPREIQTRAVIPPTGATLTIRGRKNGRFYAGTVIASLFLVAGSGASIAGRFYDEDKQPGRAILSYGVAAGLFGVSFVGSIIALTAGKNRVTVEPTRAARSPSESTAAQERALASASAR